MLGSGQYTIFQNSVFFGSPRWPQSKKAGEIHGKWAGCCTYLATVLSGEAGRACPHAWAPAWPQPPDLAVRSSLAQVAHGKTPCPRTQPSSVSPFGPSEASGSHFSHIETGGSLGEQIQAAHPLDHIAYHAHPSGASRFWHGPPAEQTTLRSSNTTDTLCSQTPFLLKC